MELPPSPLLKGGGVGPSKNCATWGVPKILLERGNNPEKGGSYRNGRVATFFTLQSLELAMQHSCPSLYSTKTLYISFVYFWFILILYRKCWLLYLFKLVWNTQKITWTSTKVRYFLMLKIFWCLNALLYCFFLHIFEVKVSNFYWPITWEM